eukprot:SAG31_NODE_657_length_13108_cov_3.079330_4_plen_108_part_00
MDQRSRAGEHAVLGCKGMAGAGGMGEARLEIIGSARPDQRDAAALVRNLRHGVGSCLGVGACFGRALAWVLVMGRLDCSIRLAKPGALLWVGGCQDGGRARASGLRV